MDISAPDIIDALGGTSVVARMTETPISTVHSWRRIGIPASRLAHLKLAAQAHGKGDLLDTALSEARPQPDQASAA